MSRFKRIHVGGLVSSKLLQVNLTVDHKENCEKQYAKYITTYNHAEQVCTVPIANKGTCQVGLH